jgi:hypothetical protein
MSSPADDGRHVLPLGFAGYLPADARRARTPPKPGQPARIFAARTERGVRKPAVRRSRPGNRSNWPITRRPCCTSTRLRPSSSKAASWSSTTRSRWNGSNGTAAPTPPQTTEARNALRPQGAANPHRGRVRQKDAFQLPRGPGVRGRLLHAGLRAFPAQYFPGRQGELKRPLLPEQVRELFGSLSVEQMQIIQDNASSKIW